MVTIPTTLTAVTINPSLGTSPFVWIVQQYLPHIKIVHVLDDFLFVAPSYQECSLALAKFKHICDMLGVPLAPEKTMGPATSLPFLGIDLDTHLMQATLPEDKIQRMLRDTDFLLSSQSVVLKRLQSINGLFNFACQVIVPARAFMRSLFEMTKGVPRAYHHVRISLPAKKDLQVWREFLAHFNRKSFFLDFRFQSNSTLHLYTDSAASIGMQLFLGMSGSQGSGLPHTPPSISPP